MQDLGEACAYLRDPILRARYEEIAAAVSEKVACGIRLEDLMGGRTDALKTGFQSDSFPRRGRTTRARGSDFRLTGRTAGGLARTNHQATLSRLRFHARPDRKIHSSTANRPLGFAARSNILVISD